MTNEEFEFILFDRIVKIQAINEQYDLENNAYIAFSGGKDSTILHYLLDLALPNNTIPRVYSNTGIEYVEMVKFVKKLSKSDSRIVIVKQDRKIKETLEKYDYPFKSKEHSQKVKTYKSIGLESREVRLYLDENRVDKNGKKSRYVCPKILRYQFETDFNLKISKSCCDQLKKRLIKKWIKDNPKKILMTGMRKDEGGIRSTKAKCISTSSKTVTFNPLLVVTKDWEEEFIKRFNIELCKLYYPPFNFERTGCKGCPFAINLQEQLDVMERLLPNEKKQCEILWKPVYDEYRRLGYRLRPKNAYKQTTIFDYLEEVK